MQLFTGEASISAAGAQRKQHGSSIKNRGGHNHLNAPDFGRQRWIERVIGPPHAHDGAPGLRIFGASVKRNASPDRQ